MAPRFGTCGAVPGIAALLSAELENRGWSVTAYPWGRRSDAEPLVEKVVSRPFDAVGAAIFLWRDSPDVLMLHSGLNWRSVLRDLALCALTPGRPWKLVLMAHGSNAHLLDADSGKRAFRAAARRLLRTCDAVLVLSEEERERLAAAEPHTPVTCVDNPFVPAPDASRVRPEHPDPGLPTVLFIGRVVREKGVFDLVQALSANGTAPRFRLVVAGDGPDMDALMAEADRLDVASRVECLGWVEGDALAQAYGSADVFALPTYFPEGFPTVVAEAMSHGLPIVCTDARGIRDRLVDGENALFVPPRDPAAVRFAILRLLDDAELAEDMSRRNRQLVTKYAPGRVVGAYDSVLRTLVPLRGVVDGS